MPPHIPSPTVNRASSSLNHDYPSKLLAQDLEILCQPVSTSSTRRSPWQKSAMNSADSVNLLCCVKSSPYLFFSVTRCLEYLSSGEKRAGCADLVTSPETTFLSV
ncbi:hypothetical protein ONS95_008979 [Cadophora gregata]|uniref:uncharacterized protein n=1 Tax=Cadophora gregata TaxID=51156 RepID=UPI0026DAA486|nr:uncharacterized protein ONS95_008979 [Cadophora gregata]KAK0123990.1 hypothetical protein ONS95_008979 [Cadophora gregata]